VGYKENVMIFDSVFLINKTKEIVNTFLISNKLLSMSDNLYTNKVVVKKVLLKMLRKSLSDNFGVNMVCDVIDDTDTINNIARIAMDEVDSAIWHICRDIIGYSTIQEIYVDIIVMGHNMHVITTRKLQKEIFWNLKNQ